MNSTFSKKDPVCSSAAAMVDDENMLEDLRKELKAKGAVTSASINEITRKFLMQRRSSGTSNSSHEVTASLRKRRTSRPGLDRGTSLYNMNVGGGASIHRASLFRNSTHSSAGTAVTNNSTHTSNTWSSIFHGNNNGNNNGTYITPPYPSSPRDESPMLTAARRGTAVGTELCAAMLSKLRHSTHDDKNEDRPPLVIFARESERFEPCKLNDHLSDDGIDDEDDDDVKDAVNDSDSLPPEEAFIKPQDSSDEPNATDSTCQLSSDLICGFPRSRNGEDADDDEESFAGDDLLVMFPHQR